MILRHTDRLSQTLQQPKLSSVEGHELAMLTVKILKSLRNDENFDMFWLTVEKKGILQNIYEPRLARRRKLPRQLELGIAVAEFALSPEEQYRRVYFEALDLAMASIRSRFNQRGFRIFSKLGTAFVKASGKQCFNEELDLVCNFFYEDFNREELVAELATLGELFSSAEEEEGPSVESIKNVLLTLCTIQRKLLTTLCKVFQLLLILPATMQPQSDHSVPSAV